jgi:hypothetical protein
MKPLRRTKNESDGYEKHRARLYRDSNNSTSGDDLVRGHGAVVLVVPVDVKYMHVGSTLEYCRSAISLWRKSLSSLSCLEIIALLALEGGTLDMAL